MAGDQGDIELEHALGYSGNYLNSAQLHPDRQHYFYITGACTVIGDLTDPQNQTFLRGHDDTVTCVAVSKQGHLIATGQRGYNADVLVWEFQSGSMKFRFSEHDHEIVCLDFSHDDRLLVSCGNAQDGKLFIWDCLTGCIVSSASLLNSPTTCVKFGGFRKDVKGRPIDRYQLASAGQRRIIIWALNPFNGELENEALNTGTTIRDFMSLSFSPNGERFLFAGTTSGDFLIFQMKNNHLFCIQAACASGIPSIIALSEESVAVGGGDGTLSIFQINNGRAFETNRNQFQGALQSMSCNDTRTELLVGTSFGFILNVQLGDLSGFILSENHTKTVTYVSFPRGISDKFGTCSQDGTIRIWDGSDYSVISRCIVPNAGAPTCFAMTLEIVISGWEDGKIRAFRADNGQALWTIDNAHRGGVTALVMSSNQRFIVTGGVEGEIRVWEIRSKDMISHLKEHTSRINDIVLLPDDIHLISVSRDKCMLTWDLRSDKRIAAHAQRMGGLNTLTATLEPNVVISAGQERKISKWNLQQTNAFASVDAGPDDSDEIYSMALSHNGRFLATGGEKMVLRIWEVGSMRIVAEGNAHSGAITKVAWSYDDKQVVSTGRDNCALIWNIYF